MTASLLPMHLVTHLPFRDENQTITPIQRIESFSLKAQNNQPATLNKVTCCVLASTQKSWAKVTRSIKKVYLVQYLAKHVKIF